MSIISFGRSGASGVGGIFVEEAENVLGRTFVAGEKRAAVVDALVGAIDEAS